MSNDFETELTLRLAGLAEQATRRGVPADMTVRAMLAAALAVALRHDNGANIARQLQPVLDELAGDEGGDDAPCLQ